MKISVFWDITSCSPLTSNGLHGVMSQKIELFKVGEVFSNASYPLYFTSWAVSCFQKVYTLVVISFLQSATSFIGQVDVVFKRHCHNISGFLPCAPAVDVEMGSVGVVIYNSICDLRFYAVLAFSDTRITGSIVGSSCQSTRQHIFFTPVSRI
jgi:hypothetical protein